MDAFRRLMGGALAAGAVAGLALFIVQWAVMVPLIQEAERYEHAAHATHAGHAPPAGAAVDAAEPPDTAWQPSEGLERTAYTALGTVLTGIGYAAVLFGVASILGVRLEGRRAWWLGLAGFACFALGPALGLPPRPPGAAVPELQASQIWWIGTALATGVGLWLLAGGDASWQRRGIGLLILLAPHLVGAPHTDRTDTLPRALVWQFALASVGSQAVFWLILAKVGSLVQARHEARPI